MDSTRPNVARAAGVAVVVGIVAAVIWAVITKTTDRHIGYLAIGVGLLVGVAVRVAGGTKSLPGAVTAGLVTLVACFAGDMLAIRWLVSDDYGISLSIRELWDGTVDLNTPMTYVIYAIGVGAAFTAAGGRDALTERTTEAGAGRFTATSTEHTPTDHTPAEAPADPAAAQPSPAEQPPQQH